MKQIIIALILLSTVSAKAELVSHWAFDETNGATAFNSVSGTNGTIETGVVIGVETGKIGTAYQFDAVSNAYVDMDGYKGILGTTSRTVNIWLKTPDATASELIAWGGNGNANGARWFMLLQTDGEVRLNIYGGDTFSSLTVTNDIWRMFTVVLTNDISPTLGDAKLYIDGTNDPDGWCSAPNDDINTQPEAGDVRVGKNYTGLLDDPAIWDEGFTTNEITCLYDAAQIGYNAYYFDQLKQLHDAGTGSAKPLDEWWEYASGLTGSPGLNISGVKKWFIFDGAAGTGVRLAASGAVFGFK